MLLFTNYVFYFYKTKLLSYDLVYTSYDYCNGMQRHL